MEVQFITDLQLQVGDKQWTRRKEAINTQLVGCDEPENNVGVLFNVAKPLHVSQYDTCLSCCVLR